MAQESTELKKLHELIKNNPLVLEIKSHKDNKESDDESNSEADSDSDQYVSTKEIEIQKLDETIRYLKLDLNNAELKAMELEEKLQKEVEKNKQEI